MATPADPERGFPTALWCAPGVFLAAVHEDVVVLDLEADRYNCLLDASQILSCQSDGSLRVSNQSVAEDLQRVGIADGASPPQRRWAIQSARRELSQSARSSIGDVVGAALALSLASVRFRGRSLSELVGGERRQTPSSRDIDELRLTRLVSAMRIARPWIPIEGECLKRSFQLKRFLAGRGIATDWIFGVRTWPFAAHCWLQIGDLVVGDRLDRVSLYTPIMAA